MTEICIKALRGKLELLTKNDLGHMFTSWIKQWDKCITFQDGYFEMENVVMDN